MEARERGVLVGQPRWLQGAVGVRMQGHRVQQRGIRKPRRGHRQQREEEEADRPGDEDRVAEQQEAVVPLSVEEDRGGDDHRPVAPDVDPVGEGDDEIMIEEGVLE
jgi:hypothetical protein